LAYALTDSLALCHMSDVVLSTLPRALKHVQNCKKSHTVFERSSTQCQHILMASASLCCPQHAIAAIEHGAAQHADGRGDAEGVSGMPADVPQQPVNPVSAPHEEAWHASTAELAKSSITASDGVTGVHAAADCKPDCNTVQHTSKTQGSEQSFDMLDDDSVEGSEQSFDMLDDASMDGPAAHISGTDQKQHSLSALEILMSCCLTQTVSFCLLLSTSQQLPQDQQTLTSAQLLAHLELQHHWLTPLLTLA